MNNISIIIPIHKYDDDIDKTTVFLINSILNQENVLNKPVIVIVYGHGIDLTPLKKQITTLNKETNFDFLYVENKGNTSYQSQVNLGVDNTTTKYFSVVEFDDELSLTYLKNITEHIEAYPNIDIFLPMIVEVDIENKPVKITNETTWSQQFVGPNGTVGYLNEDVLKSYSDFKLSGAVIKKESFINSGKYKTNIELTFMYEYLLRTLNCGQSVYTVPKLIYKHLVGRPDSLFDKYSKNMAMNERKFWFDVANREYLFTNEREIAVDFSK